MEDAKTIIDKLDIIINLLTPATYRKRTDDDRKDDYTKLDIFINSRCIIDAKEFVIVNDFNQCAKVSQKSITKYMASHGYTAGRKYYKGCQYRVYFGLRLISPWESPQPKQ